MKLAWFCIPAYGHTNPTIEVVRELVKRGHEVRYYSFEEFREKIEDTGAVFVPIDSYLPPLDKESEKRLKRVSTTEMSVQSFETTARLDPVLAKELAEFQPDGVVSDSACFWGKLTAIKQNLPLICSTTTFAFNRYSARYMQESIWDIGRMLMAMPRINRQLKRLREKGYPVKSLLDIVQNDNDTNTIVYTSGYFQPCSETFSDRYHFIGPSIRPITAPVEKTSDKTIYISMGTVNQNRQFYRNCINVLAPTGWQVIISMGTNTDHFDDLPENIQVYESVDQMAVLSIADAFITHCGMNSASEGLYYGVPLVLFPQTPEQNAVATRVEELGAGVRLRSISEEDVFDALKKVINEPQYKEGAARISESFKSCGGMAEAKAFLEQIAAQ